MSKLLYLGIHCSATNCNLDVKAEAIRRYHMETLKWSRPGYRTVIELDGKAVNLVPANVNDIVEDNEMTWGIKGLNRNSHHICYVGGISSETFRVADTRTEGQLKTMEEIVRFYIERMNPDIKIVGHNQFATKLCPSFWVPDWLREIGIPEKNILDTDRFNTKERLAKGLT